MLAAGPAAVHLFAGNRAAAPSLILAQAKDPTMAVLPEFDSLDLERQVKALGSEVARLNRLLAKRGSRVYDDASETASGYYDDLVDMLGTAMPALRKRAASMEKTVYDHPAIVAAVGLAVIGLMATLFVASRSPAPPPAARKRSRRPAAR
jgi:hypothetical protein